MTDYVVVFVVVVVLFCFVFCCVFFFVCLFVFALGFFVDEYYFCNFYKFEGRGHNLLTVSFGEIRASLIQ